MVEEIQELQEKIKDLESSLLALEERIDEVEAVAVHQSRKVLATYARQTRTVFFGFCCFASVVGLIFYGTTPALEKLFSTLATAFGLAAVANSTKALDSVAGDLFKSIKR